MRIASGDSFWEKTFRFFRRGSVDRPLLHCGHEPWTSGKVAFSDRRPFDWSRSSTAPWRYPANGRSRAGDRTITGVPWMDRRRFHGTWEVAHALAGSRLQGLRLFLGHLETRFVLTTAPPRSFWPFPRRDGCRSGSRHATPSRDRRNTRRSAVFNDGCAHQGIEFLFAIPRLVRTPREPI